MPQKTKAKIRTTSMIQQVSIIQKYDYYQGWIRIYERKKKKKYVSYVNICLISWISSIAALSFFYVSLGIYILHKPHNTVFKENSLNRGKDRIELQYTITVLFRMHIIVLEFTWPVLKYS